MGVGGGEEESHPGVHGQGPSTELTQDNLDALCEKKRGESEQQACALVHLRARTIFLRVGELAHLRVRVFALCLLALIHLDNQKELCQEKNERRLLCGWVQCKLGSGSGRKRSGKGVGGVCISASCAATCSCIPKANSFSG